MAVVEATYEFRVDIDEDGWLMGSGDEDVTLDVAADAVTIFRGLDTGQRFRPARTTDARFRLLDDVNHGNGKYRPGGTAEPQAGQLMQIRATDPTTAIEHQLATVTLDEPHFRAMTQQKYVDLSGLGGLARVSRAGSGHSTAVLKNVTTDVALNALFDAVDYPKNLQGLSVNDLGAAGYWHLGDVSGNILDQSGNGNDLVPSNSPTQGQPALDDAGEGSVLFDGVDDKLESTGAATELDNIWDGSGGACLFVFDADTDGEGSVGRVIDKTNWYVRLQDEAGGNVRLRFFVDFTTTDGIWQTAVNVPTNTTIVGVIVYNSGATGNNPTLYLWDGTNFSVRTVGSGLTETSTPAGSRVSDASANFVVGNNTATSATFDGHIGACALFSSSPTTAEAKALVARAVTAARRFDVGRTVLREWWLDDDMDPRTEIDALVVSEGPGAALFEEGSGTLRFQNRHHRILATESTTVQTRFRETGTEPLHEPPFVYENGRDEVVNVARFTTTQRSTKPASTIWELDQLVLDANEVRVLNVKAAEAVPFENPVVSKTDISGSVTITLGRTSGSVVEVTFAAGGSGWWGSGITVDAQLISIDTTTTVETTAPNQASLAKYGRRLWDFNENPVRTDIAVNVAQDWCDAVASWYANGRPTAQVRFTARRDGAAMTAALAREISDLIGIDSVDYALTNAPFWLNAVEHMVDDAGKMHRTILHCEAENPQSYFVLDSSQLNGTDGLGF